MAQRSALGRFFRYLADFFDRRAEHKLQGVRFLRAYAGTPLEIDFFAFGLLFLGILIGGIIIHGFSFFGWVMLLALVLSAGAWLIFYSAHWREPRRSLLFAALLVLSADTVAERLPALFAFMTLYFLLLQTLLKRNHGAENARSVVAVMLFCFVAYDGFSAAVALQRSALLNISSQAQLVCGAGAQSRVACRAGTVRFDVPDFWQKADGSNLIEDLETIVSLKIFQDSATDNKVAFAAFSAPPETIMTSLRGFLNAQKAFMRSRVPNTVRGPNQPELEIRPVMQAADIELHTITYVSSGKPGYLGGEVESTAFLLLHRRRELTWLFILDGTDFSGREFLLHRIISGFR